jgi:hypothetical protein
MGEATERLMSTIVLAVVACGQRAIVQAGWTGLGKGMAMPPCILLLEGSDLRHDWLFPR